jgi:hypothetical protein
MFLLSKYFTTEKLELVSIFSRELIEAEYTTLFSVGSIQLPSLVKARAVVTLVGSDVFSGSWQCSKDGTNSPFCPHIKTVKKYLGESLENVTLDINQESLGKIFNNIVINSKLIIL